MDRAGVGPDARSQAARNGDRSGPLHEESACARSARAWAERASPEFGRPHPSAGLDPCAGPCCHCNRSSRQQGRGRGCSVRSMLWSTREGSRWSEIRGAMAPKRPVRLAAAARSAMPPSELASDSWNRPTTGLSKAPSKSATPTVRSPTRVPRLLGG